MISSGQYWQLHEDIIKWKYFLRYRPFVRGIHQSPVNSPHKGQWRGALMFSLVCAWTNDWVNNRDADDLRRHRVLMFSLICARMNDWVNNREVGDLRRNPAHYDVTVIYIINLHILAHPSIARYWRFCRLVGAKPLLEPVPTY